MFGISKVLKELATMRLTNFKLRFALLVIASVVVLAFEGFGKFSDDVPQLEEKLKTSIKKKDYQTAALLSLDLGKLYQKNNQAIKALEYFAQSLTYGRKADDFLTMYHACNNSGEIYFSKKSWGKAEDHFQKAIKYARELEQSDLEAKNLINLSKVYEATERFRKAIPAVEEAKTIAIATNNNSLLLTCYQMLSDYHGELDNEAKTKEFSDLYEALLQNKNNKAYNSKLERQIKHVGMEKKKAEQSLKEVREISEKRKLEIDLLHKDKQLSEMRIKEQNARLQSEAWIRNFIIVVLILGSALVIVFIKSYRKKLEDNKKIDLQNKNIKSSINYAKRIQEAMLPKTDQRATLLPESFVLFKPRDSVSGDFYWITEIKNWYNPDVVFAAVDCTGHGVPGAFMSMIGINALNGIISRGIAETNQILEALDNEIRTTLQQEKTGNNDGMDIALCIYRKEMNIVEFSGAKNPLVYVQNNELHQIKGDVYSIGGNFGKEGFKFKTHKVLIDQPTMLYLFSDGYKDQFGGQNQTKFMSKKFQQLLLSIHKEPLHIQMEILEKTIESWKGPNHQTDDILVMGIALDQV